MASIIYLTRSPEIGSLWVESLVPIVLHLQKCDDHSSSKCYSLQWQHLKQKTKEERYTFPGKNSIPRDLNLIFHLPDKWHIIHTYISQRPRKQNCHKHVDHSCCGYTVALSKKINFFKEQIDMLPVLYTYALWWFYHLCFLYQVA